MTVKHKCAKKVDYLYRMLRIPALFFSLLVGSMISHAQTSYLTNPGLMALADSCLQHTYNFSFSKAKHYQSILEKKTPNHPAPFFLKALVIYWENFPLLPDDKPSEEFIGLMDRSIELAEDLMQYRSTLEEGVFFDLFGRAFKAMFWADNGKPGKVIPDLRTMYKHTMEGFDLMRSLNEFYFSTGLYNYYIEAYPEAHPVYKPLLSFMQDGDRELGLIQLNYAIRHALFLRVEATLFMSLIQLNYENDLNSAAIYAARLYREYPENIYYQGHLLAILLHLHRYDQARQILIRMSHQDDGYSQMIRTYTLAFLAEMESGDDRAAGRHYREAFELAESFGPIANNYKAMASMGLSRLYKKRGKQSESKRFSRKASNLTVYRFILDEKHSGPR